MTQGKVSQGVFPLLIVTYITCEDKIFIELNNIFELFENEKQNIRFRTNLIVTGLC